MKYADGHRGASAWVSDAQDEEKWLSVEEVAARWRISKMTVYRMIESGELKAHKFSRLFRVTLTDVVKHEQSNVFVPEPLEEEATG